MENIIGRAIALVWPTDRATELEIPASFDVLDGTTGVTGAEGEPAAAGTTGRRRPGRVEHRLAPAAFLAHHGNAKSRFAGHVEGGHPWGQGATA